MQALLDWLTLRVALCSCASIHMYSFAYIHPRMHYDKDTGGENDDITTTCGWARAILLVLRLRPSGLLWGGVPCGSFVWLSRSKHGRSCKSPCGFFQNPWVKMNNMIAERFSLLAMLAVARRCHWTAEARLNTLPLLPKALCSCTGTTWVSRD